MSAKVMGIVNVTPDSFSDGGRYFDSSEAIKRAKNCIKEGADIIDLGGESTRPNAKPITWEEEWKRIEVVLEGLKGISVPISVDTYHPETAIRAIELGAKIINCVYTEPVHKMLEIVASHEDVELVIPAKAYDEGVMKAYLPRLYLDPMIGFNTTREEDLSLLSSIGELAKKSRVLVGASRKRIIKKLVGEKTLGKNLGGNLAVALWCVNMGASVVRVHDVAETVEALKVWKQLP